MNMFGHYVLAGCHLAKRPVLLSLLLSGCRLATCVCKKRTALCRQCPSVVVGTGSNPGALDVGAD